jgi:hypothetical protein
MGNELQEKILWTENETRHETEKEDNGLITVPLDVSEEDESDIVSLFSSSNHSSYTGPSSVVTPTDDFGTRRWDRAVLCSKGLLFFVLMVAAAAISIIVFVVIRNGENRDFQSEVRNTSL